MFGFKQVGELTLDECLGILEDQSQKGSCDGEIEERFWDLLRQTTFEENYYFLKRHLPQNTPFYLAAQTLFEQRTEEIKKQENDDYQVCEQLEDYRNFVSIYEKMLPAYSPVYLDEARGKIQQIQEEQERKRKEEKAEREARRRKKRKKALIISLVLVSVAGVILLFVFGWESANHCFSYSSISRFCFDKGGGERYLSFYGPSSAFKLRICAQDTKWINYKVSDYRKEITLTAIPNEGGERKAVLKMIGYPTFWGLPIRLLNKTRDFEIIQESGEANTLDVVDCLEVSPFGETQRITIKTDGVKLVVKPDSDCEKWVQCTVQQENKDKDFYHNDIYEITVDKNTKGAQTGKIIVETGGMKKEILIKQASLATEIVSDKTSFHVGKYGGENSFCLETDGGEYEISTNVSWIRFEKNGKSYYNKQVHVIPYRVYFEKNKTSSVRNGEIKISYGNTSIVIKVNQDSGLATYLQVKESSLVFDATSGRKYITFSHNNGLSVNVKSNRNWLYASVSGNSIAVTCDSNPDSPRDGTVTLTCGDEVEYIRIQQRGEWSQWEDYKKCDRAYLYVYVNGKWERYKVPKKEGDIGESWEEYRRRIEEYGEETYGPFTVQMRQKGGQKQYRVRAGKYEIKQSPVKEFRYCFYVSNWPYCFNM